jgi:WLM domain
MIWLVIAGVLFVILLLIFRYHQEPPMLTELKKRYWAILDVLRQTGDPMWKGVLRPSILTGMHGWDKSKGPIGSNVNKGYEIYICLDGDDVNSATYVLIHELAHMSVPEYDHTKNFWTNFEKLKALCVSKGLYKLDGERKYCGDVVKDGGSSEGTQSFDS